MSGLFGLRLRLLARMMSVFGIFVLPYAATAQGAPASTPRPHLGERVIKVDAHAFRGFSIFDGAKRQFGKLTFMGGLELRSSDPSFGGISSALIDADGKGFVALSDQGHWITGRFTDDGGVLSGVEDMRIAPMLAPNGRRMKETRYFDSEGLARIGDQYFVSVERTHDILRFDRAKGRPTGRGTLLDVPLAIKTLNTNQGIESLGVLPRQSLYAGALIAIAERAPKSMPQDTIPGWLIGGKFQGPLKTPGQFALQRRDNFDVTDLGFLPGGDLLILERRFVPFLGLSFRIRRIAISAIKPGALIDGETLIEADLSQHIDNMEALMVHRASNGKIILTLISDNNFSILQRNLVLRFSMDE